MHAIAGTARAAKTAGSPSKLLRAVATFGLAAMMTAAVLLSVAPWNAGPSSASEVVSYTVRPGDTLWSYAARITPEGGNVAENVDLIMRLNHMDSARLEPGQRIRVPKE